MENAQWWSKLLPSTRDWLIENNGDRVPAHLVEEIRQAGGPTPSEAASTDDGEAVGGYFPDEIIDWIEAAGNDEGSELP